MTESDKRASRRPRYQIGRRRFVQRMTAEATVMAGRVQGLSQVLVGSIGAAGQAVVADLETLRAQDGSAVAGGRRGGGRADGSGRRRPAVRVRPRSAASVAGAGRQRPVDHPRSSSPGRCRRQRSGERPAPGCRRHRLEWHCPRLCRDRILAPSHLASCRRPAHRRRSTGRARPTSSSVDERRSWLASPRAMRSNPCWSVRVAGREDMLAEDPDRLAVLLVPEQVMTARRDPLVP